MTRREPTPAVIGDLAGEQFAFEVGAGLVVLDDHDVVAVSGPDRLSWLTTLSSQVVDGIGEESRELLLLDSAGHIAHAAGVRDDGETTWLLTGAGRGGELAAFLDRMRFLLRVEVNDRSAQVCQIVYAVDGPVARALPEVAPDALTWVDPWPGLCAGGASYTVTDPHPGEGLGTVRALLPRRSVDDVVAHVLDRAHALGDFPLETEDGYRVERAAICGTQAWRARRIRAARPDISDVDARGLPHEYDWLRTAVHLDKGCYCGQETVARIVNLGRPPRRLVACDIDGTSSELPPPGARLFDGERAVGHLTTTARDATWGPVGLGLIKRAVRTESLVAQWSDDTGEHRVAVAVRPLVDPDGRSSASPQTRPGAGVGKLPGASSAMRVGGVL